MLKLSRKQMETFSHAALMRFETQMLTHLRRFFPESYQALGDDGARELIHLGLQRTASHHLVAERDVCKYINLMVVLGRDFDHRVPWAREILNDHTTLPPEKLRRLYQSTIERAQSRS
jgi:hypothetical protein